MDVVATRKRARSPSPYPDTLTSPLEVLLKRRRQGEWDRTWDDDDEASSPLRWARDDQSGHGHARRASGGYGHRHGDHAMDGDDGSGVGVAGPSTGVGHDASVSTLASTWRARGVEHRRSRAWQRLQAPSGGPSSQPAADMGSGSGSGLGSPPARVRALARADSLPTHIFDQRLGHSHHNPSLTHPHPHVHADAHAHAHAAFAAHSQHHAAVPAPPSNAPAPMSSSPVRHRPPSSTPFRDPREGEWTPEERMREWGEYSSQNTLLHSLHLARLEALEQSPAPPMSRSASHDTPSVTHSLSHGTLSMTHGTPQATRPRSSSDASAGLPFPFATPGPTLPAASAWGQHQRTPLVTPGLVSSPYESSPGAALSPLRALHTPASAFPSGALPVPAPSPMHESAAVRASYEETNRLLAALNVARIQRRAWCSSSVAGSEEMDAMDES